VTRKAVQGSPFSSRKQKDRQRDRVRPAVRVAGSDESECGVGATICASNIRRLRFYAEDARIYTRTPRFYGKEADA
jgi:hypothetical protein